MTPRIEAARPRSRVTCTARAVTNGAETIEMAPQNRIAVRRVGFADDVVDALADLGHQRRGRPPGRRLEVAPDEEQAERRQPE